MTGSTHTPGPERRRLSPATAVRLIAWREIRTRFESTAFKVMTVLMVLAAVALPVALDLFGGKGDAERVGFTQEAAALAQPFTATAEAAGTAVDAVEVGSRADGEKQVRDGDLAALVVGSPDEFRVVVEEELAEPLTAPFDLLARQQALDGEISDLGGDPAEVNRAVAGADVQVDALEKAAEVDGGRIVLGIVTGVLIYMSLLVFGQYVAMGVVEEKTSRVVELLLAAVTPAQLMAGKVLGIGLVGLTNLALTGGAGLAAALATDVLSLSLGSAVSLLVWLVVWYLVGFFMYALLLAGTGAMVSRQEDVGGAIMPVLMLLIVPYVLGASILPSDPDSPLIEALSIIPLFAPTLMPIRLALGEVPFWQAGLALVLALALIPGLVWLSARIYRNSVLRTGARVSLKDSMRRL